MRGDAYAAKGEQDRAKADFRKAIELYPDICIDFHRSGLMRWRQNKTDRAIEAFDAAIKLNPQYAEAFYNRGAAYTAMGDFSRAIADYSEAIRIDLEFRKVANIASPTEALGSLSTNLNFNTRGKATPRLSAAPR